MVLEFDTLKNFLLEYIPLKKLIILTTVGFIVSFVGIYLMIYSKMKWVLWLKNKVSGLTDGALSVFKMPNKLIISSVERFCNMPTRDEE